MSLDSALQAVWGFSVLRHGLLCPRRQSNQNAAGDTPAPNVCPIGRHQGRYPIATEIPLACWPLVIGAVGHGLRLSALGLMVVSFFWQKSESLR